MLLVSAVLYVARFFQIVAMQLVLLFEAVRSDCGWHWFCDGNCGCCAS